MTQDNTLILLGVCGFLTVCFGLLVLAFVTIFKYSGRNFMGFMSLLVRNQKEVDKDDDSMRSARLPNFRRIADDSDFDAAVAKHAVIDHNAQSLPGGAAQVAPPVVQAPYNQPLTGTPKPPTVLPGYLPGTASAQPYIPQSVNPVPRSPAPPPAAAPITPDDWDTPSLTPRRHDPRRQDDDDDDDLIGGLLDSEGGMLG